MSENAFQGHLEDILMIDIDGPLATINPQSCEYYTDHFGKAAAEAEKKGTISAAQTYRFLQQVTGLNPTFDNPQEPYGPSFRGNGRRSLIPSDLTKDDLVAIRQALKATHNPALRARLLDLLWTLEKDHVACGEAVESYIASAQLLNTEENWVLAGTQYQRALQLAAKLGRTKDLYSKAIQSLRAAIKTAFGESPNAKTELRCHRFLKLLEQFDRGDFSEFAQIAFAMAENAAKRGDFYDARHYWEIEADFHKRMKNQDSEKAARLKGAESLVFEAEKRINEDPKGALVATTFLADGIEALRRAGAAQERIQELRQRLVEYQFQSTGEMGSYSTEVDISKVVDAAQEHVKNRPWQEALFRFALGRPLTNITSIRESVLKSVKEHPLTHLVSRSIVDEKGRTTKIRGSLLNLTGDELEKEIEAEMFWHCSQFVWPIRVSGFIEPARLQILNDHHPTLMDLAGIVYNNPFVPPEHEGIFLRGIHAGFHGDFLVSSHLLVPQIENSIRFLLETNGVDVSNLLSDGTQPVKILGPLFDMPETKQLLGESLWFELRGLLIEKTGNDFRNMVAHGFVSEAECYSVPAITIWWLVVRLCAIPVYKRLQQEESMKAEKTSEEPKIEAVSSDEKGVSPEKLD